MCFLCNHQYTPIGGWDTDHQNHDDDRPFSHRYCSCAVNSRPHPWVPTAGWLIIPHLKKQFTNNGRTYDGLISLILSWAKLSPYVMRRFPGRVRIVYRLGPTPSHTRMLSTLLLALPNQDDICTTKHTERRGTPLEYSIDSSSARAEDSA